MLQRESVIQRDNDAERERERERERETESVMQRVSDTERQ